MSELSRETVRKELAARLAAPGVMPTAQGNIFDFMRSGFEGMSPVVRVMTAGSERPPVPAHGVRSKFYYTVQFWVLYYEKGTPAQQAAAEDTLDALELELLRWAGDENNRNVPGLWTHIEWVGASRIDVLRAGGHQYLVEDVPIGVHVYG